MIISGGSRTNWRYFARHLTNAKDNDRVEVVELRGLGADSVFEGFREMHEIARFTRCGNFFYHADINPREDDPMTREQAVIAADWLQKNLGLEGQPRIMVEHVKDGRQHWHIAVLRIDMDSLKAIPDSHNFKVHAQTARELEREFGHTPLRDILVAEELRPERRPKNWEKLRSSDAAVARGRQRQGVRGGARRRRLRAVPRRPAGFLHHRPGRA
jgi:MobA/VirD2-like, nuclease domain